MSAPTAPQILRAAAKILRHLGDNQLAADVQKKAELNWERVELHLEDEEHRAGDGEGE